MAEPETIEGEIVEAMTPAVRETGAVNLFGDASPVAVIQRATEAADALAAVIEQKQLYKLIGQKKHVFVEGWTLLGSMLGVFPVVEWTRQTEDGWEARVVARTRNGDEVGAAEAMCSRREGRWKTADEYAIRSMAQTRAVSKALRHPLGFVMTLAGYEATPEAEMPDDTQPKPDKPERRVEGPEPLRQPGTWPKVQEMVGAYDKQVNEWFFAYADSARRYMFPNSASTKEIKGQDAKDLLRVVGAAALALRQAHDPQLFPGPSESNVMAAYAAQLEGVELAIPEPEPESPTPDA